MLLNPYVGTTGVGTGGVTYFFEERFEGTGYDNSNANGWSESGTGTINEDYTTSPLEGSQSLRIAASAQAPILLVTLPSDENEFWMFFRMRIDVALSSTRAIFQFRNSSAVVVSSITLVATTNQFQCANGTIQTTATTDGMTTGTDYYTWFHWLEGSGANGQVSFGFSTTGTEITSGTTYKGLANGNAVTDVHDLRIGFPAGNSTGEFIIDQILMSTTGTIGDSPA